MQAPHRNPGRLRHTCAMTCITSRAFAVDKLLTSAEGVPDTKSMVVLPLIKGAKELMPYPGRRPVHVDIGSGTGPRGIRNAQHAGRNQGGAAWNADKVHGSRAAASFAAPAARHAGRSASQRAAKRSGDPETAVATADANPGAPPWHKYLCATVASLSLTCKGRRSSSSRSAFVAFHSFNGPSRGAVPQHMQVRLSVAAAVW